MAHAETNIIIVFIVRIAELFYMQAACINTVENST